MRNVARFLTAFVMLGTLLGAGWVAGDRQRRSGRVDRVVRRGNVHPLVQPEADLGRSRASLPMERIIVPLPIRPERKAALDRLLAEQQDPSSSGYHRWLTPAEFGARFGASSRDIAAVREWLEAQGLAIDGVAAAGTWLDVTGSVADVERAFETEIHDYLVDGEVHHANASEPSLPAPLAGIADVPVSLHDFRARPGIRWVRPQTELDGGGHALSPADFATIYDVNPLYAAGLRGDGATIAVISRTEVYGGEAAEFRRVFGLLSAEPQFVFNGPRPGIVADDLVEANLDIEWSAGIAPGSSVEVVVSRSTSSTDGIDLSAQYAVDNNLAAVLSLSYGSCEAELGAAKAAFYADLWAQAAAQGITCVVASGDSGAAGCDDPAKTATTGLGVNGLASTPYDVCVGGTEFLDAGDEGAYWSPFNDRWSKGSALTYIPEAAWNESAFSAAGSGLWASGGGVSALYAKPAWQAAPGVPADGMRDVPDVALAAAMHTPYLVAVDASISRTELVGAGGTSAAAPAFAGLAALIVEATASRQGNIGPRLYQLGGAQYSTVTVAAFHDVTMGGNTVSTTPGFVSGTGFDPVTGLGSVDATALIEAWSPAGPDFNLSAPASAGRVPRGQWVSVDIGVMLSAPLVEPLVLSASGPPDSIGASFDPDTITSPGGHGVSLTIAAADDAPLGSYVLTVAGRTPGRIRTCTVEFTVVDPPLQLWWVSLAPATVGMPYAAQLTATGGAGGNTWTVEDWSLPLGLELTPGGLIQGIPAVAGGFPIAFRVTDRAGSSVRTDPGSLVVIPAACGSGWRWANPVPTGARLVAVTWVGSRFLAFGGAGTVLTSADGVSWSLGLAPPVNVSNVIWSGSETVAVGDAIATSADGSSWVCHGLRGTSVAWSGQAFVAVGPLGSIESSAEGGTWTPRYSGTTISLTGVAWTGSQFVAIGRGVAVASRDGQLWRRIAAPAIDGPLAWTGTRLVAAGSNGVLATSPDGVEWSFPASPTHFNLHALVWNGSQLVVVGESGAILTSPDGTVWTPRASGTKAPLAGVAWSGTQYVAVGGSPGSPVILTSPDGVTWTPRTSAPIPDLVRVRWAGNRGLALGWHVVVTSPDGIAWTSHSLGKDYSLSDVVWTGSQYVGVGSGLAMTSPDGNVWTPHASGSTATIGGAVWAGGKVVAVGTSEPGGFATILTSADGVNWHEQVLGQIWGLRAVCWTGSRLVAVGGQAVGATDPAVLTSADGATWAVQSVTGPRSLVNVIWTGERLVAVGDSLVTSVDGTHWTTLADSRSGQPFGPQLAWTGSMFVSTAGVTDPMSSPFVYTSPDGIGWTSQAPAGGIGIGDVAWTGSHVIAVGAGGAILTSECASVCAPPTISSQPQGATVGQGRSVRLSVTASGSGPLYYQWSFTSGSGTTAGRIFSPWSPSPTVDTPPIHDWMNCVVTVASACGSTSSATATLLAGPSEPRRHLPPSR